MNKGRRNELAWLKYKKRVSRWNSNAHIYVTREGEYIYSPRTIDVINDHAQYKFKHTAVVCSCWVCSGEYKYKRHQQKREDEKLIAEALNNYYQENDKED